MWPPNEHPRMPLWWGWLLPRNCRYWQMLCWRKGKTSFLGLVMQLMLCGCSAVIFALWENWPNWPPKFPFLSKRGHPSVTIFRYNPDNNWCEYTLQTWVADMKVQIWSWTMEFVTPQWICQSVSMMVVIAVWPNHGSNTLIHKSLCNLAFCQQIIFTYILPLAGHHGQSFARIQRHKRFLDSLISTTLEILILIWMQLIGLALMMILLLTITIHHCQ